jgi:hypothetical protein
MQMADPNRFSTGLWKDSLIDLQKDPLTEFQLEQRTQMVGLDPRWMELRKDSLIDLQKDPWTGF